MMTVKQVSSLTGITVRTLQFYDEIGLFKPTAVSDAGYRLYDDGALKALQQILFFKELDFSLKEIRGIMESPDFDRNTAFRKQKELLSMKRDRLNRLLGLLDKLIKGETCMDFKTFDMSEYIQALADFKKTHCDDIIRQLGSMEQYDEMVEHIKSQGDEFAQKAAQQYGSIDSFTNAMKANLKDFLENGPSIDRPEVKSLIEKTEELTKRLTADLSLDPASSEVREKTGDLIAFCDECNSGMDMGENYWRTAADSYLSVPAFMEVTDKKYGKGASKFIGRAILAWLDSRTPDAEKNGTL